MTAAEVYAECEKEQEAVVSWVSARCGCGVLSADDSTVGQSSYAGTVGSTGTNDFSGFQHVALVGEFHSCFWCVYVARRWLRYDHHTSDSLP